MTGRKTSTSEKTAHFFLGVIRKYIPKERTNCGRKEGGMGEGILLPNLSNI